MPHEARTTGGFQIGWIEERKKTSILLRFGIHSFTYVRLLHAWVVLQTCDDLDSGWCIATEGHAIRLMFGGHRVHCFVVHCFVMFGGQGVQLNFSRNHEDFPKPQQITTSSPM